MTRAAGDAIWFCFCIASFTGCSSGISSSPVPAVLKGNDGVYHVRSGQNIQAAIEAASKDPVHKTVRVHAGTYRPSSPGQALVWFNRIHDGITLEAQGEVILSAANETIADKSAKSFPAIVNHVLYFGDGVTEQTIVRGFTLTGAKNFVTRLESPQSIQPETGSPDLQKDLFFYADGGGIKIFGRSSPTILNMTISENYVNPCGAGISIEQRGFNEHPVVIRNCIFRNNRCQITGSAVDILPGSSAQISNCLFVGNVSNTGVNYVGGKENPYNEEHGSGAMTVFPSANVKVDRCTFTGNWNGTDDKGTGNAYTNSIYWRNIKSGGICPKSRYELDILDGRNVTGCFIQGQIGDLRQSISVEGNTFDAPDPDFDSLYRPRAAIYTDVGYRPDSQE